MRRSGRVTGIAVNRERRSLAGSLLRQEPVKTPREHDPEMPLQSKVNGLPRYQHQEMTANFYLRSIWVEPRESTLAPVGEGFLFNNKD